VTLIPILGLVVVALLAILFASFTLLRGKTKGRAVLAAAIALFLLGVSGGSYWILGQPHLAMREARGLDRNDIKSFLPLLIARVRQTPEDEEAWTYLGRTYLSVGDSANAAKAYARVIALQGAAGRPDPDLLASYGELLMRQGGGAPGVEAQAEAAFNQSLALNPKNVAARYYLAQMRAMRGDTAGAGALLQSLLADLPPGSPLRARLQDRIAMLSAGNGNAPNPRAMVASLAARLKTAPNDAAGWQRLIRAYSVLGESAKAKDALATARKTFASQRDVLAALDAEAKSLKLN
jgi:cytochrome c-type biogenesis protein CcmH